MANDPRFCSVDHLIEPLRLVAPLREISPDPRELGAAQALGYIAELVVLWPVTLTDGVAREKESRTWTIACLWPGRSHRPLPQLIVESRRAPRQLHIRVACWMGRAVGERLCPGSVIAKLFGPAERVVVDALSHPYSLAARPVVSRCLAQDELE